MKTSKTGPFETRWEHRRQPLASRRRFIRRQLRFLWYSTVIIGVSLLIGTAGYCYFGNLTVICGFYNASMILTGMGPVDEMTTDSGRIFASLYALYSGIAFLSTAAVLLAPILHRVMHMLHLDDGSRDN